MCATGVLDGDEVVAGSCRGVRELVAFISFHTVQLDFGRAINSDGQRSRAGIHCVHDEGTLLSRAPMVESVSVGTHHAGVGVLLAHQHTEWAARDVVTIETHVDHVETILTRDETNGELV